MKATATNGIEINTGDPVLIRDTDKEDWRYVYFSHISNNTTFPYASSYGNTKYCIPYKGNEHLAGTNNNYKSYEEKQEQWIKENNIKIGDKVKIIEKSFINDNGWNNDWIEEMNFYIGKIGIINEINNCNIFITFIDDRRGFWFPYHVLKKVEDKIEFRFGAKVKGVCEDNSIVEGILISYDKEDITLPYCIAIQKEKKYRIGIIEWVKSIEYID